MELDFLIEDDGSYSIEVKANVNTKASYNVFVKDTSAKLVLGFAKLYWRKTEEAQRRIVCLSSVYRIKDYTNDLWNTLKLMRCFDGYFDSSASAVRRQRNS